MLISRANVVSRIIACMSYGVFWPADVAKNLCCYFANRNFMALLNGILFFLHDYRHLCNKVYANLAKRTLK